MSKCKKFVLVTLVILAISLLLIGLYLHFVVYPFVLNLSTATVNNMYSSVITEVADLLKDSQEFDVDFFHYEKDSAGAITAIIADTSNINQANFLVQRVVYQAVSRLQNVSVPIKLGAFSGSTLLAAYGPTVGVEIMPVGAVKCRFVSKFSSTGLNQTLHKIYIEVTTDIDLMLPLENVSIAEKSEILIAENVIVGAIPDTYLEGTSATDYLDLVP